MRAAVYESWIGLAVTLIMSSAALGQQDPGPGSARVDPSYKTLRYEEDWAYLKDADQRSDYLDGVKYIPLRNSEDWYVSIGGELRERYERFGNPLWGQDPEDNNGFFLQRIYAAH
jgi:hypothetical protein